MTKPDWTCTPCGAVNTVTVKFCEVCGEARNMVPSSVSTSPPDYLPPWKRPGWKDSKPEDPCGEPGCELTIRDHIEAFKKSGQRMLARVVRL